MHLSHPRLFGGILSGGLLVLVLFLFVSIKPSNSQQGSASPETLGEESGAITEFELSVAPGFEVQHLYRVPGDQGTWVSLTIDNEGNLIASDQRDKGMYRIRVRGDLDRPEVDVEKLAVDVSGVQGLVWAFDHLYANVNGAGLYRMRDSDQTGEFDVVEFLGGPARGGEHGNHSIIRTADGEGLYYGAGNFTPPPENPARSRVPTWEEDLLLPRQWDARGHARGILAPGGYIARIDPEAREWEMVGIGYRNSYDITLNEHGDLFTYDSDMEWDIGMPWYRPTALVHVTSGSDYGWRSGSGKWPDYFEDKLPPLVIVGPGSPTGLISGSGARFPERYQRALFGLDWTFGTIYAFHLTPKGAGYEGELEEFVTGNPLPVTYAVIGNDGALYFTTGGRSLDSNLFRVVYRGDESTDAASPVDNPEAREARELRRRLEAFHGRRDEAAVETAWPHLAGEDRLLRGAARLAIESQPVETWFEKALAEERPQARITAIVALARSGGEEHRAGAIQALLDLDMNALTADQQLGMLRAYALLFIRLGDPDDTERTLITNALQEHLPSRDNRVNTELIRVLVYLQDSRVIAKAMELMQDESLDGATPDWGRDLLERNPRYGGVIREFLENPPPIERLNIAFMLRNQKDGWTLEERGRYFTFINEAGGRMGGRSYTGFLERMREEALENATEAERAAVAHITSASLGQEYDFVVEPPEGPGRAWTVEEAVQTVADNLTGRDFYQGRNVFFATGCVACHRFNTYGSDIGPDLTNVESTYSITDLLAKIIDPNRGVSDQYTLSIVTMDDGRTLSGLVVERGDYLEIHPRNWRASATVVAKDNVRSVVQSDTSPMPPGLINSLNADELRDVVAYMMSRGDENHDYFRTESGN